MVPHLFVSHSSQDDPFVRDLQQALGDHGVVVWIDSRDLLPGGLLAPDIKKGIDDAAAIAVVVSPDALQSRWVGKEISYAMEVQKQRGRENFPVIPLSLDGTRLGVLENVFGTEPTYIPVSTGAGGAEAAVHPILVALALRKSPDVAHSPQPAASPFEELVLELTHLGFEEKDGARRASAEARLIYEPAAAGQPHVYSNQRWRFVAPIGPIEAEELRWYLEKFAIWPSDYFRDRAHKVEENLVKWGQLLHAAAMPADPTGNVTKAWNRIDAPAGRRFSVYVDAEPEAGAHKRSSKPRRSRHSPARPPVGTAPRWEGFPVSRSQTHAQSGGGCRTPITISKRRSSPRPSGFFWSPRAGG